ncbi:MAG TPA: alkaline phosphatase family protein [Streptosporangiaceae bacterium]|nr:alkaline phosphatase family protein [Streptosporangiaceae bacterium]
MRLGSIRLRLLRLLRAAGLAAVAVTMAASAAAGLSPAASAVTHPPAHQAPHVMTIMMENTDYSQAAGSAQMPYLNQLARQYTAFTQAYGWRYPSLPNYMELLAGSTHGITSDCDPGDKGCTGLKAETLTDQLEAARVTWHGYYQDDVSGCDTKSSDFFHGNYDVEHNPFAYLADFATQCQHLSNFGQLLPRLESGNAPDFNWVVPDLDNDGGDNGTMSSGDTWLSEMIPQIMHTPWYRQGGQIVIMYDTGYGNSGGVSGSSGGQLPPLVVVSAHTRGLGLQAAPLNTAGVLRSVEQAYGLKYLGDAGNSANGSLGSALVSGRPQGSSPKAGFTGAVVSAASGHGGGFVNVGYARASLALDGVARVPGGGTIEVGENHDGQGVIAAGHRVIPVPGTSDLESVSCATATTCWATGLATVGSDQGALVRIVHGRPVSVKRLPAWYGLYGIACPTASTCEAVGYDTSDIADAVTTITNGKPGAPAPVKGGGEWLNAISCPTATQCYATGLVNYTASIVPVTSGTPQAPITMPGQWYLNGIDCPSAGNCVVDGEAGNAGEGSVSVLAGGVAGQAIAVPGTENLYGVACSVKGMCLLTGASQATGASYSHGVLVGFEAGKVVKSLGLPGTNGLGQVACSAGGADCVTVGAALTR